MRFALVLIWVVMLVAVSLSPWEVKAHLHSMGRFHHLFHLAAFTVTAILLVGSERSLFSRTMSALVAVGLAFTTELLEQWRFHNPFEWVDIQSDCEGIILGLGLLTLISTLTRNRRQVRASHRGAGVNRTA